MNKRNIVKTISCVILNKNLRRKFRDYIYESIIKYPYRNIKPRFEKNNSPEVSIIMPVYNQYKITFECLKSMTYYKPKVSFEVIIADDCSKDRTAEIEKIIPNIKLIRTTGNFGFLKNVKNAVSQAKGKYIFLMNNDMLVKENWLDSLYQYLESHSDVGIVGSLLLYNDDTIQEYGATMNKDGTSHLEVPDKNEALKPKETDYCSGCSIMFLKSDWDTLGGFDEQFAPAYYEDSDFGFQMRYILNKKSVCLPDSQIYHLKGKTYSESAIELGGKNRKLFLEKWKNTENAGL